MHKLENVIWQDVNIGQRERELRNGHKAGLVWLTGLPCSGKSTIAKELQRTLFSMGCRVYVLDGDNVRHELCSDLGFSAEDRVENLRRVGAVARLFVDAGIIVIAAFIAPFESERKKIRSLFKPGEYTEVFLDTDVDVCEQRDVKGMYARARKGEIENFTGISAAYEKPVAPEIAIPTAPLTVNESVDMILRYLKSEGCFEMR